MPDVAPPHAIYHLNPLAAGPLDGWPAQLERIAGLGFDAICLASPFATAEGLQALLRDPGRLHAALGGGDALAGLRRIAEAGRAAGLATLLDWAPLRLARDAVPLRQRGEWQQAQAGLPPDPRRPAGMEAAARLASPLPEGLGLWWQEQLAAWAGAGIAGFRCLDPGAAPPGFLARRIAALRERHPGLVFIAWTPGSGPAGLQGAGFDLVAPSLPWWDFSAGWWSEETARLAAIAPLVMAPEDPFGPRLAARHTDRKLARREARRALDFAAATGRSWLMPMGFEFGALHRAGAGTQQAAQFAALAASPRLDLTEAVRAANAQRAADPLLRSAAPPRRLSAPGAPLAILREAAAGRTLIVTNASLLRPARVSAGQALGLLDRPGALPPDTLTQGGLALGPGETRCMTILEAAPVQAPLPADAASVAAATAAPRIAIEAVKPAVDDGRFAVKRAVGQAVEVTADIFTDGHGKLAARLLWRPVDEAAWRVAPMAHKVNDIWVAHFLPERVGRHVYAVEAWVDHFEEFRDEIGKKQAAGVPVSLERREGLAQLEAALTALKGDRRAALQGLIDTLPGLADAEAVETFLSVPLRDLMREADAKPHRLQTPDYPLDAERRAAGFSAWYEIFPRSQSGDAHRHGTFDDVIKTLPRVKAMGFDVLYFPPIHPIGKKNRKGPNNTLTPSETDPGSPYAIGSAEGGHDALHPELGSFEDFRRLIGAAAEQGLELALDFAIQCSPDHPWLREHPEWFTWRPDGSIRYAENPPKKYEDIVNVEFYAPGAVPALWLALRDAVLFWVQHGIRLFRVDNPHTKPLPFWEWMIGEVRARAPDAVFLSEAFTRPKVMYRLAKVGFSQSYTYFTWRNSAWEMREYLEELNRAPVSDFFRPHFFVNTPDINPVFLQTTGRPGHLIRAGLAATLSGLWGVYNGFELCEAQPLAPGKEEYLDSEKYEIRVWDYDRPGNIIPEITMLNRLRQENPALHTHLGTTFLRSNHDGILAFVKTTAEGENTVLVAISMDPNQPLETHLELPPGGPFRAENLVAGGEERWEGTHRPLRLDPHAMPFAIWRLSAADKA
ncbi:alpha-1,4-glucan--maltose-1-phosphate maltosyltransferase [Roseomonas sp. 18066]|uniref:alpha-1,4-glucan--maltose-1-phosphate maltosyltransferase n=1 Tax=Roseomonas sp. 18066 TaxID=2681412 RepID=UPI0013590685|nr:alpha-1,4-glucan--maltose-1-phosphate maltosyltransferase [Roseomonas sp. 18066]